MNDDPTGSYSNLPGDEHRDWVRQAPPWLKRQLRLNPSRRLWWWLGAAVLYAVLFRLGGH